MSVYVGIDVHRKRSQVAVITEDGTVVLNKTVPNGSEPMLRLIGDLPSGTPVAFEAAFGWGWLVQLLEDYGFDPRLVHPLPCKAIASTRLKNDTSRRGDPGAAAARRSAARGLDRPPEGRQLRALIRHRASLVRLGTGLRNRIHAAAAVHGYDRSASYCTGPGRGWLAETGLARRIAGDRHRLPGGHRPPCAGDRAARQRAAPVRQGRPAGQGAPGAARRRGVHGG